MQAAQEYCMIQLMILGATIFRRPIFLLSKRGLENNGEREKKETLTMKAMSPYCQNTQAELSSQRLLGTSTAIIGALSSCGVRCSLPLNPQSHPRTSLKIPSTSTNLSSSNVSRHNLSPTTLPSSVYITGAGILFSSASFQSSIMPKKG